MSNVDVSVVIAFKNWGAERLEVAARSIIRSLESTDGELIISDYGSDDAGVAEQVADAVGAIVVRTVEDPVWSRSRALNAGFAKARGQLLISTDADMVFAPETIQTIYRWWKQSPDSAYFLQCRDLPRDVTTTLLSGGSLRESDLEQASIIRPRWGMGGMMAISRNQFAALRGFDERLHTYGREDMDFALRARRAGHRNVWIEAPEARMYHMWHKPASAPAEPSDSVKTAVARNRKLVDEDKTWVRNIACWRYPLQDKAPLIRVVLMDARHGELTEQTIRSLQAQSVDDWEALVVINSNDIAFERRIGQLDDRRVRTVGTKNPAGSEAPLASIIESPADFIMFLEGGCILPPKFLETQLASFAEGVKAVRARQVDFEKQEIEDDLQRSYSACMGTVFQGQLARQIAQHAPNEFHLSRLSLAMDSLGCITVNNPRSVFFRVAGRPGPMLINEQGLLDGLDDYLPYLPDGYIERDLKIEGNARNLELVPFDGSLYSEHYERDGERVKSAYRVVNPTYRDMAWLRTNGFGFTVHIGADRKERTGVMRRAFLRDAIEIASENRTAQATAVVVVDGEALQDIQPELGTIVSEHCTGPEGELFTVAVVVFSEGNLNRALISLGGRIRVVLERYTEGDRIED